MKNKIQQHEKAIEILEAIKAFKKSKQIYLDDLKAYPDFLGLKDKWEHKIEIYQMCVDRMKLRYDKLIKEL